VIAKSNHKIDDFYRWKPSKDYLVMPLKHLDEEKSIKKARIGGEEDREPLESLGQRGFLVRGFHCSMMVETMLKRE
jgi:hypothetical protein